MIITSVFRSAITDSEGAVDAGYLALFWTMTVTLSLVPLIGIAGLWMAYKSPDKAGEIMTGMGVVIGALGAQCAATIGAVGLFRAGDKPRQPKG